MADADASTVSSEPLFKNLDGGEEQDVTEVESLCMNCYKQGMTRLLLTKIPFFKEVIISSFCCDECGFENREVQFGGKIQDKGIRYSVEITHDKDLNRQMIKSDYATWGIPKLEFEQPPNRKGEINTVEGMIDSVITGLSQDQEQRRAISPESAEKIDEFIAKLTRLKTLDEPFVVTLEDPSGNSYIENMEAPKKDEQMTVSHFTRSRDDDVKLGLAVEEEDEEETVEEQGGGGGDASQLKREIDPGKLDLTDEVMCFKVNCTTCNSPCDSNMKIVDIPYFKQVIVMAVNCDVCGYRDNEVKSATGVEEKAQRITLKITKPEDLNRDVLKSDTCGVRIPELDLELVEGSLGGRFTTVEGLLVNIRDQLGNQNPFLVGDSSDMVGKLKVFNEKLGKIISGEWLGVHFILEDPAGNSYLQNLHAPDEDPEMVVEKHERTDEQNDLLGLKHMNTENYTENS